MGPGLLKEPSMVKKDHFRHALLFALAFGGRLAKIPKREKLKNVVKKRIGAKKRFYKVTLKFFLQATYTFYIKACIILEQTVRFIACLKIN